MRRVVIMGSRACATALVFLALGCGSDAPDAVAPEAFVPFATQDFVPVEHTRIVLQGVLPQIRDRALFAIRDEVTFRRFWEETYPGHPAPRVGFPGEIVVVSTLGTVSTDHGATTIARVGIQGGQMVVEVQTSEKAASCPVINLGLECPTDIVKVRNRFLAVQFAEEREVRPCVP